MTNKLQADSVSKAYWSLLCLSGLPSAAVKGAAPRLLWKQAGASTRPWTDLQAQPATS